MKWMARPRGGVSLAREPNEPDLRPAGVGSESTHEPTVRSDSALARRNANLVAACRLTGSSIGVAKWRLVDMALSQASMIRGGAWVMLRKLVRLSGVKRSAGQFTAKTL